MGGDKGAGQELGRQEGEVVINSEGLGFCVKVVDACHLHAAYCSTEGSILEGLDTFDCGGGGLKEVETEALGNQIGAQ